jgi:dTDP-4-dehydrorhamnose reductase
MPRVLITGSKGMLGKDIVSCLAADSRYTTFGLNRTVGTNLPVDRQLAGDLADPVFLRGALDKFQPQVIVHCAACTDVDACERDRDYTRRLHVESTGNLASHDSGRVQFVYISTDSVFDGNQGDYREEDPVGPLNYYARTKQEGEGAAREKNPDAAIIRTNIFGFHRPAGKSLAEWALENLEQGKDISGFRDILFNPIYTKHLAKIIKVIIENRIKGILNVAGHPYLSKYDFLRELAKTFGFPVHKVLPGVSTTVKFSAPRPRDTTLNLDRLAGIVKTVPGLQDGLRDFRADYPGRTKASEN